MAARIATGDEELVSGQGNIEGCISFGTTGLVLNQLADAVEKRREVKRRSGLCGVSIAFHFNHYN
ncbi:hypothetical protein [Nitrosomonas marina]|uniref:hypothetical protein n=1 Tax=Nitrosomonas marina TaxID=917 RepID=UPI000B809FCA|nr:hypothetical protein [Nitrosomonas marina]